jgi:hypothetical protein
MADINTNTDKIVAFNSIPYTVIGKELNGTTKSNFLDELREILGLYSIYDTGSEFIKEGHGGDYIPANLNYKKIKTIINKEARFLFSNSPDYTVSVLKADSKIDKENSTILQNLVDKVLKKNNFNSKLIKAAKDCFIGRRVACYLNFNEKDGIKISFVNSQQFYYETADVDSDTLSMIMFFPRIKESTNLSEVRIFKKKYWMDNGFCWVEDIIYDGNGEEVEVVTPATKTLFDYIPATVIVNDGLTNDLKGESEVEVLTGYESWYSRLSNADMDAERKSMNPVRYSIDCDPNSTKGLSSSAGSFWDLTSDENSSEARQGQVGILESTMAYKDALKVTLDRINTTMYEQVDVPNVSSEALQGVVTSGKTLKAIYWGLVVRCDEKMLTWRPALELVVRTIIDGSRLYPNIAKRYTEDKITSYEYEVSIENNYPLPEDEAEEKTIDIAEVTAQTMSKKSYMKKWRNLTDEEADEELKQIALERELLEDSFGNTFGQPQTNVDNNEEDDFSEENSTANKELDDEELI